MPRHPRAYRPYLVHHAIARFARGEYRIKDERYRAEYFNRLGRALARGDWRALSACAMCSHVHLGLLAGMDSSEHLFRSLHTGYAMWLNQQDDRFGPVYAERPKLIAFDGESLLPLIAYHHNNPVHAGLVSDPADSAWSTHRAFLALEPAPPWLDVERALGYCGFDSSPGGRAAFHDAVCALIRAPVPAVFHGDADRRVRRIARETVGAPVETATPFVERFEARPVIDLVARGPLRVRPRWSGEALAVVAATALALNIPVDEMRGRSRRRPVTRARRVALIAWVDLLGRYAIEMACALGICTAAAAKLRRPEIPAADLMAARGVAAVMMSGAESEKVRSVP